MTETRLHASLRVICKDLSDHRAHYALVGGLAVSARTEPRFTRDLDMAVAVADDREAETLVQSLRSRRYSIEALVEHEAAGRLATVRLIPIAESALFVDLLFASSGIEAEIVAAAEPLEIIEGLVVPVATVPHLIATKVLSRDDVRRPQDRADLIALLRNASETDIAAAQTAMQTIQARGFNRGRDLIAEFETLSRPR
jgi:predicted nucleotidyltransferase